MEETRFLCDLPWKHLSVHPHGVCSVCCVINHKDAINQMLIKKNTRWWLGKNEHKRRNTHNCKF